MPTKKVYIPHEEGFGTPQALRPVSTLINSCRFNSLFSHIHTEWIVDSEMDKAAVEAADAKAGGKLNAPLQINSIYVLCPYVDKELGGTALLKTLRMRRSTSSQFRLNTQWEQEREVKAFPSLGIHKDITFIDEGNDKEIGWYNKQANILWISDVTHHQESVKGIFLTILQAIRKFQATGKVENVVEFTMGADPEFEIINKDGTVFNASSVFAARDVGHDGHAETGEIRPEPANRPLRLVRNVKRLMWKVGMSTDLPEDAKVFAGGGTRLNVGGHIHFGLPRMSATLQNLLFDMVAAPTQAHQGALRNGISGFRKGGGDLLRNADCHTGVEWRPLPSWIVNEDIASAVVVTTYAIVKSFYAQTISTPITKETYRSLYYYPIYKDYIERFIELFIDGKCGELSGKEIRTGWGIKRKKLPFNIKIVSRTDWLKNYFKPINCPAIKKSVRVTVDFGGYNELMLAATKPLSSEVTEGFRTFADSHFVELRDGNPSSLERPYRGNDLVVLLPVNWSKTRRTKDMFNELKGLVQQAIVEIGKGGRS